MTAPELAPEAFSTLSRSTAAQALIELQKLALDVFPKHIVFENVRAGTTYRLQVELLNQGRTVQRIRVHPPRTSCFRIEAPPSRPLAPGLSIPLTLIFRAEDIAPSWVDELEIETPNGRVKVPVVAHLPRSDLRAPDALALGTVAVEQLVVKHLTLENHGTRAATFHISERTNKNEASDIRPRDTAAGAHSHTEDTGSYRAGVPNALDADRPCTVHAYPSTGVVSPGASQRIKIEFMPRKVGSLFAALAVSVDGQLHDQIINISAAAIEHRVEVVWGKPGSDADPATAPREGSGVRNVDFGTLFFREKTTREIVICNNGPTPQMFALRRAGPASSSSRDGQYTAADGRDSPSRHSVVSSEGSVIDETRADAFSASPAAGTILPFESARIVLTFSPTQAAQQRGFASTAPDPSTLAEDMVRTCTISVPDLAQHIPLTLRGRALPAQVSTDTPKLVFGACVLGEARTMPLVITNQSDERAAQLVLQAQAHFRCKPKHRTLLARESVTVDVTFAPRQLGEHRALLRGSVNGGEPLTIAVQLLGITKTPAAGDTRAARGDRTLVQGIDKLPGDFGGARSFAPPPEDAHRELDAERRLQRTAPQRRTVDQSGTGRAADFNPAYTVSPAELQQRKEHKQSYHIALAQNRALRRARELRARRSPSALAAGVDMGLEPAAGLASPRLALPRADEPLFLRARGSQPLSHRDAEVSGYAVDAASRTFDPDRLVKVKFKPKPRTQAEQRDCRMQLEALDVLKVRCGPKVLDFGAVSINASVRKTFAVFNETSKHVLVEMDFDFAAVASSTPASQVVPPGALAGFDVVFTGHELGRVRRSVSYSINGSTMSKFTIAAHVVPIHVELSEDRLAFTFDPASTEFELSKSLRATNTGNHPAQVAWAGVPTAAFDVRPPVATIEAGRSKSFTVVYTPKGMPRAAEDLVMRVADGPQRTLACRGEAAPPKCRFAEAVLDFGTIPFGSPVRMTATLRNGAAVPAAYRVVSVPQGISVEPRTGAIPPESALRIPVVALADAPCVYAGGEANASAEPEAQSDTPRTTRHVGAAISIEIRGAPALVLPVIGTILVPTVAVHPAQLAFGSVYVGGTAAQSIVLSNQSPIAARCMLDLTHHKDFTAEHARIVSRKSVPDHPSQNATRAVRRETPSSERRRATPVVATTSGDALDDDPILTELTAADELDALLGSTAAASKCALTPRQGQSIRAYVLYVPPLSVVECTLTFAPRALCDPYAGHLPLSIAGQRPRGKADEGKGIPSIALSATTLEPLLRISRTKIDMGQCVILQDHGRQVPHTTEILLANDAHEPLQWSFDVAGAGLPAHGGAPVWSIEPSAGRLDVGAQCAVRIAFAPRITQRLAAKIPVVLNGDTSRKYLDIVLTGTGILPRLAFDRTEVVLPIVPVRVRSTRRFYILNQGFDNLDLQYRLPNDTVNHIPLAIDFPEGTLVGIARNRLAVDVSLCSAKPVSFSARIEFLDNEGSRFGILVSGTTDASVLTTYPFLLRTPPSVYAIEYPDVQHQSDDQPNSASPALLRMHADAGEQPARARAHDLDFAPVLEAPAEAGYRFSAAHAALTAADGTSSPRPSAADENSHTDNSAADTYHSPRDTLLALPSGRTKELAQHRALHNGNAGPEETIATVGNAASTMAVPAMLTGLLQGESVPAADLEWAMRWANASALPAPLTRFPEDITSAHGAPVVALIENLSGKRIPGMTALRIPQARRERAIALARHTEKMLMFLKTHGALLATVRAEYLLPRDDFVAAMSAAVEAHVAADDVPAATAALRHTWAAAYPEISRRAWYAVLMQVVRVFAVARVRPDTLDGTHSAGPAEALPTGSNVYSPHEQALLRWLTVHAARAGITKARSVQNFTTDLADGLVFGGVLLAHCPFLFRLHTLIASPANKEQRAANAAKVHAAMRELELELIPEPDALLTPRWTNMLLLSAYLFDTLPLFTPRATIEFATRLNDTRTKAIELTNPAKKTVTYVARVDGSQDFSLDTATVAIPPGQTAALHVTFRARFSRQITARLFLRSHRVGATPPAMLVFALRSKVAAWRAADTVRHTGRMYEARTVDVPVTNPFNEPCSFAISLQQTILSTVPYSPFAPRAPAAARDARQHANRPAGRASTEAAASTKESDANLLAPTAYAVKASTLELGPGERGTVQLQFLPFVLGKFRCAVLFVDRTAGEFVIEAIGESELPPPAETIKLTVEAAAGSVARDVTLAAKNALFERAKNAWLDRNADATRERRDQIRAIGDSPSSHAYTIEYTSSLFSGPRELAIPPSGAPLRIPLVVRARAAGLYHCKLLLRCDTDVRIAEVDMAVSIPSDQAALHFAAPARRSVSQDIPLANATEKAWTIRTAVTGDYFRAPREIMVPPRTTRPLVLSFAPEAPCSVAGELVLTNTSTNDKFAYRLLGEGSEPLAEDHLVIDARARSTSRVALRVPHLGDRAHPFTLAVESDIPFVGGEPSVTVPAGADAAEYELAVRPTRSGVYRGSVSFAAAGVEALAWYTLEVRASRPEAEQLVSVQCRVREAVAVSFDVHNPEAHPVDFSVDLQGNGLLGDPVLTVPPHETVQYEAIFAPLVAAHESGSVAFVSNVVGEYWYEVDLCAERPPPAVLPPVECIVGASVPIPFTLENPSDRDATVQVHSSHPAAFVPTPASVTIGPLQTVSACVEYSPAAVGQKESATITCTSSDIGEWVFELAGTGLPPSRMPMQTHIAPLENTTPLMLSFRNPFSTPLPVDIRVQGTRTDRGAFELLLQRPNNMIVDPKSTFQIPIAVTPFELRQYETDIAVNSSDKTMEWVFPVKVSTSIRVAGSLPRIECRCRDVSSVPIKLELPHVRAVLSAETGTIENSDVSVSFAFPESCAAALRRAVTLERTSFETHTAGDSAACTATLAVAPLRSLRCHFDLVVKHKSGAIWNFEIPFLSTDPEFDDTITIEASINQTVNVAFTLCNLFSEPTPFSAYFAQGSSLELSVTPREGILPPAGSHGQELVVTFSPREYGSRPRGKLVIQTDEAQWLYAVHGCPPAYVAPAPRGRIDNKEPRALHESNRSRRTPNFVARNTAQVTSPASQRTRKQS